MIELYPHQVDAVSWMQSRERSRDIHGIRGGILGDEMGLGKTITVLECIRREGGRTLIVCPLCLVDQWISECDRVGIPTICIRTRDDLYDPLQVGPSGVVIAAHTCFTMSHQRSWLMLNVYKLIFQRLVVDEAHMIRNRNSTISRNLCAFPSDIRWAVSGTPVVNVVIPPRCVHAKTERTRDSIAYAAFLTNNTPDYREIGKYLSSHMSEIMLRRLKTEVWSSRTNVLTYHGALEPAERRVYDRVYSAGVKACSEDSNEEVCIVTLMLRLRQICSTASWKFEFLRQEIGSLPVGTKSLVFCSFRDEIDRVNEALEGCIDVVMQYHGSVPQAERLQVIETFRQPSHESMVIVMQVDCGGTGLNLQEAQHVFIMSPTWSPSVERQAIGRADRVTTNHTVRVHRLVTQSSIESFMYNRQHTKDCVTETLLSETPADIRGRLMSANGMLPAEWNDLCNITTFFDDDMSDE